MSGDRWMPSDAVLEAEAAVIGAAIQSKAAAEIAAEKLTPRSFYMSLHAAVFEAVTGMLNDGTPIDAASVLRVMHRGGQMVDGVKVFSLAQRAAAGSLGFHIEAIARDATRRELLNLAAFITEVADPSFDPDIHLDKVRERLDAISNTVTGDDPPTAAELLYEVLEDLEKEDERKELVQPPYRDMERLVPALEPGELILIGARPSVGKSTVAMDFARYSALHLKKRVLFASLEMTGKNCMQRLVSAEATVDLAKFKTRSATDVDWDRIAKIKSSIEESELIIDAFPGYTLGRLRARLRREERRGGCQLVIVDYLQLMKMPPSDSREQAVAATSRGLKLLALEFQIPIVLLAQLNRGPEHRTDKTPVMSDFRESGALEQDADIGLLLFREDASDQESSRAGELDLIVAKNRNGARGTVTVAFQGHYSRAMDMAPREWSPTGGLS
jgi:replicative DNA helicase